jgi:hypothetical protein
MNEVRDTAGRFRAGTTGNPRGRPRKARGVDASIMKAVNEAVMVTEGGRRKRRAKLDITATQIANKGAAGDLPAAKLTMELVRKAEANAEAAAARSPAMTRNDHEIAASIIARLRLLIFEGGCDDQPDA